MKNRMWYVTDLYTLKIHTLNNVLQEHADKKAHDKRVRVVACEDTGAKDKENSKVFMNTRRISWNYRASLI